MMSSPVVEQNVPHPLQVYRRRQRPPQTWPSSDTSVDPPTLDLHVPIAIRKDKCSTIAHLISHFVSYDHLSPSFRSSALFISTESIPKNYQEALLLLHWKAVMDDEMEALVSCGTWDLITRLAGTRLI